MARLQKSKQAAVTTGSAKSSGLPCAMVLTLMACSPREPGLIAPVITRLVTARLDLSVGRPGPHAFASASAPFVRTRDLARVANTSIASRLAFRDDSAYAPLAEAGRRASCI